MNVVEYKEYLESQSKLKRRKAKHKNRVALLKGKFENDLKQICGSYQTEYVFAPPRKFRFDYLLLNAPIAFELNGGTYQLNPDGTRGGRHNIGAGYEKDLEKINLAQITGYMVFQFTYNQIQKNSHLNTLKTIAETLKKDM